MLAETHSRATFKALWLCATVAVVMLHGCSGNRTSGGLKCKSGHVAVKGKCAKLCKLDADCPSGSCTDGYCAEGGGSPLVIQAIDGDGAIDSNPSHTHHHAGTGLVISGTGLLGVSADLKSL